MFDYWKVYLLFNGDDVVYIGCSKNIEARLRSHKASKKIFDGYVIFYASGNQDQAITTEKTLIKFVKKFTKLNVYNKQHHFYLNSEIIKL